ncbi:MAG: hypothetical protein OJF49_000221 [Ktedonobacterales bacterium]|jgi:streptogramin lyase|nr:MAG: hypothetical protein OJF49_000221 [Ktedonobacterales bacterium]
MTTNHIPPVAPTPLCSAFESWLPLLVWNELEGEEAAATQAHLQQCQWCQRCTREYETVGSALRASLGADDLAPTTFTLEAIMSAAQNTPSLPADPNSAHTDPPSAPSTARNSRRFRRASTLAPVAAVLLIAILTGALFASRGLLFRSAVAPHATRTTPPAPTTAIFAVPGRVALSMVAINGDLWYQHVDQHGNTNVIHVNTHGVVSNLPLSSASLVGKSGDGGIWAANTQTNTLWRIDPKTNAIKQFQLGGAEHLALAATGLDNSVWFYDDFANTCGRLDPTTGNVTRIPIPEQVTPRVPTPGDVHAHIEELAVTPDGVLWFGVEATPQNWIVRFNPATNAVQRFELSHITHEDPLDLRLDGGLMPAPDGSIWFVAGTNPKLAAQNSTGTAYTLEMQIVHVTPDGNIALYPFPKYGYEASGFAVDAQSNFWFLQDDGGMVPANGTATPGASISVVRVTPQGAFQTVATISKQLVVLPNTAAIAVAIEPNQSVWMAREARDGVTYYAVRIALPHQ